MPEINILLIDVSFRPGACFGNEFQQTAPIIYNPFLDLLSIDLAIHCRHWYGWEASVRNRHLEWVILQCQMRKYYESKWVYKMSDCSIWWMWWFFLNDISKLVFMLIRKAKHNSIFQPMKKKPRWKINASEPTFDESIACSLHSLILISVGQIAWKS